MYWAALKDGRKVVVVTGRVPTRTVNGKPYFLDRGYETVLLDGGFQTVRKDKLRKVEYGHPMQELQRSEKP